MAAPTVQAVGASAEGVAAVTPTPPTHQADDILLAYAEHAENATLTTGTTGWAAVADSPVIQTATADTTLDVWWKRATGAGTAGPTLDDPGNHIIAVVLVIRGCIATGDPWDVTAQSLDNTADTSASVTGDTTTVDECLILNAVTSGVDAGDGTAQFSLWQDGSLVGVTEQFDVSRTVGNGGCLGIASGIKSTAGAYGPMTATLANAAVKAMHTVALKPPAGGNPVALDGIASAAADLDGAATIARGLTGTGPSAADLDGSLAAARPLVGSAPAAAAATGALSATRAHASTSAAAAGLTGSLTVTRGLSGSTPAAADLDGDLTVQLGGEIAFDGTAPAAASGSGTLTAGRGLSGIATAAATLDGAAAVARSLGGAAPTAADIDGALIVARALSGAAPAAATLDGALFDLPDLTPPAERTVRVLVEGRTITVGLEGRTVRVLRERRTVTVDVEERTVRVLREDRTTMVEG